MQFLQHPYKKMIRDQCFSKTPISNSYPASYNNKCPLIPTPNNLPSPLFPPQYRALSCDRKGESVMFQWRRLVTREHF